VHAYCGSTRIDETGAVTGKRWGPPAFSTAGVDDVSARVRAAFLDAPAGSAVYGLFRADALARAGVYRTVVAPDRLLLIELALEGESVLVPELLWYRRFRVVVSTGRQRRSFFPDGDAPAWSFLPWWLQHGGVLAARGVHDPEPRLRHRARAAALQMLPLAAVRVRRRTAGKARKRWRKATRPLRRRTLGRR
jgi:hypothetical protein